MKRVFSEIEINNKDKIALVVVGYNRIDGIIRLLDSLSSAKYGDNEVPLVISIDASGNKELYDFVNHFNWNHGDLYINIQKRRLGLKKHIFQCSSLSRFFRAVIIFEDDLVVSPFFFSFSLFAIEKYSSREEIAGISLFSPSVNFFSSNVPFIPMNTGNDVYIWQEVGSWGQIYTEKMWSDFDKWMNNWDGDFDKIDMPDRIKKWKNAWSKFFYAYMICTNKYFLYPYISLSTNFNDVGGEHQSAVVVSCGSQVSLLEGEKKYYSNSYPLARYDVYANCENVFTWLEMNKSDLTLDFYGTRTYYSTKYVLTTRKLPYMVIRGYKLTMKPWELNIKYQIEGNDILLYEISNFPISVKGHRRNLVSYFIDGMSVRIITPYVLKSIYNYLRKRLGF